MFEIKISLKQVIYENRGSST